MAERILLITKNYPPQIGGIERYSQDLYLKLQKQGNTVYLIKAIPRRDSLLSKRFLGSDFLYLLHELFRLSLFLFHSVFFGFYYSFKSDVIWTLDGSISFIWYFLNILPHARTRVTFHAKDVIWGNAIYQLIMPFFWSRMNEVICVSDWIKLEAIKRGVSITRIQVQENSVSNFSFSEPGNFEESNFLAHYWIPENKVFLFSIWRFVEKKGYHWFLSDVFSHLDKNKYFYVLVWAWPLYLKYLDIVRKKKIANVLILDSITDSVEKARFFTLANYLIVPNVPVEWDREGSPVVMAEAFHYKLKVIASNVDWLAEQSINRETVFLPPCSPREWIACIQNLPYRYE